MAPGLKKHITRWATLIIIVLLAVGFITFYLLPSIISADTVLAKLKEELSTTIGQDVTFDASPEIGLWPTASIKLDNFIIGPNDDNEGDVLLIAEEFSANINLLSMVFGLSLIHI